jgi:hypothetical protein
VGLLAPAKTPPEIVIRMNAAMVDALNDPMVKQGLSEQGVDYRLSAGRLRPIYRNRDQALGQGGQGQQYRGEGLAGRRR